MCCDVSLGLVALTKDAFSNVVSFQDIERRLQEKEEEFENTRKNFQRALDSMQVCVIISSVVFSIDSIPTYTPHPVAHVVKQLASAVR